VRHEQSCRSTTVSLHKCYISLAISSSKTILEWGECLPDCPQEEVTAVCIMEPIFPAYADGASGYANFTSNYVAGSGVATLDVCVLFY